jgi:hypothetical protein
MSPISSASTAAARSGKASMFCTSPIRPRRRSRSSPTASAAADRHPLRHRHAGHGRPHALARDQEIVGGHSGHDGYRLWRRRARPPCGRGRLEWDERSPTNGRLRRMGRNWTFARDPALNSVRGNLRLIQLDEQSLCLFGSGRVAPSANQPRVGASSVTGTWRSAVARR